MTPPPAGGAPADVTGLLVRWSRGDQTALELLLPVVYDECRNIAARQLRYERRNHTLDPTALVHELYLRLVDQRRATWENRAQFFGVAAQLMRRILVDHARARRAEKRGGTSIFVSLEAVGEQVADPRVADVLAIDEALDQLAARDPDQRRLVEMRFFAGLTVEETAHVLGWSPRTVKREWRLAKAWLHRELTGQNPA
ncbi:MAG TPA: sigma-70 family RNA polymerase sigma factor [Gemmatimonadales bacterium]|nr:sigma-70 family RNA polymerase sigma factor [Gemmatimonadales bacterium]